MVQAWFVGSISVMDAIVPFEPGAPAESASGGDVHGDNDAGALDGNAPEAIIVDIAVLTRGGYPVWTYAERDVGGSVFWEIPHFLCLTDRPDGAAITNYLIRSQRHDVAGRLSSFLGIPDGHCRIPGVEVALSTRLLIPWTVFRLYWRPWIQTDFPALASVQRCLQLAIAGLGRLPERETNLGCVVEFMGEHELRINVLQGTVEGFVGLLGAAQGLQRQWTAFIEGESPWLRLDATGSPSPMSIITVLAFLASRHAGIWHVRADPVWHHQVLVFVC